MDEKKGLPIIPFGSQQEWDAWLDEHHRTSRGLWLKLPKKGAGIESVTSPEAVECALCYGWIDGQVGSFDDEFWLQKFTPRGPRSVWSKINRTRVEQLIAENRMKSAGLAAVEKARQDGRWDLAYDSPSTATVPEDLQRALGANSEAAAFFATLSGSNRYAILYRIQDAKRPETRARRIEKFVAMLTGTRLFTHRRC